MKCGSKLMIGGLVVALSAAAFGEAVVWSDFADGATVDVPAGETQVVTESDIAKVNKLTLHFTNLNAVVQFNTTAPFECSLTGTGTVEKISDADWSLSKGQEKFYGNFIVRKGIVRMAMAKNSSGTLMPVTGASVFGNNDYPDTIGGNGYLEICDGAQLEAGSGGYSGKQFKGREVRAQGVGPDGRGGIIAAVKGGQSSTYMFVYLTLTGDLTTGSCSSGSDRIGVASKDSGTHPAVFNMNGHTWTHKSSTTASVFLRDGAVTNAGPIVVEGSGSIELNNFDLGGDETTPITLKGTAVPWFTNSSKKKPPVQHRKMIIDHTGSTSYPMYTYPTATENPNYWPSQKDHLGLTNQCAWAGPIEFTSAAYHMYYGNSNIGGAKDTFSLLGPLTGGGEWTMQYNGHMRFEQEENPDFTGTIAIRKSGSNTYNVGLYAAHPGFLPNYAQLVLEYGRVAVPMSVTEGDGGWSRAQVMKLANEAILSNGAVVAIHTGNASNQQQALELTESDMQGGAFGIGHDGPGTLTLTGAFGRTDDTKHPHLGNFDGELKITGGDKWIGDLNIMSMAGYTCPTVLLENVRVTTTNHIHIGTWKQAVNPHGGIPTAVMRIKNAVIDNVESLFAKNEKFYPLYDGGTKLVSYDTVSARYGEGFRMGAKGIAILEVEEGAIVTNALQMGYGESTLNDVGSAVYQSSGHFVLRGGSRDSNANFRYGLIGYSGYAYWGLTGGLLEMSGYVDMGRRYCSQGIISIDGGAKVRILREPYSSKGIFAIGNAGNGHLYLKDGTFEVVPSACNTTYMALGSGSSYSSMITLDDPNAFYDNQNSDAIVIGGSTNVLNAVNCYINLLGGRMKTCNSGIRGGVKYAAVKAFINFNGGAFEGTENEPFFTKGNGVKHVTLYEKGGTIIVGDATWDSAFTNTLEGAWGNGVKSVAVPSDMAKAKFVGNPWVEIVDHSGAGYGATAMAEWDKATGKMTGIRILVPGCNYTAGKTWAIVRYNTWACSNKCTLVEQTTDGGLTKAGPGTLTLKGPAAFRGPVTLKAGTLTAGANGTIPDNAFVFGGGKLNMNGKTTTGGNAFPKNWVLDAAAETAATYPGDFAWPEGATLTIKNEAALTAGDRTKDLLTVTGTVTGKDNVMMPTLTDTHFALVWSGNTLKAKRLRGTVLLVR